MLSASKTNVFILDDHELIRRGMRQLINSTADMQVCCEAGSLAEAMQNLATKTPPAKLAIIDLALPDSKGVDAVRRLHAKYPDIRLLVFSMHDEDLFAERCLLAGALGYINKQETAEQILEALRQIRRDRIYVGTHVKNQSSAGNLGNYQQGHTSPVEQLSNRELAVYELIGDGHRTAEIATCLSLSVKTIETYRANIKRKLKLGDRSALTRSAVQWTLEQH